MFFVDDHSTRLKELITEFSAQSPLLVCDRDLYASGFYSKLIQDLGSQAKINIFAETEPEPSLEVVDNAVAQCKDRKIDLVIGVGGGSTLDSAKAISVLLTNPGLAEEYQGFNKVRYRGVPKIIVPTTAGTGSEATASAVFVNKKKNIKGGINSPFILADVALLDPSLTLSAPLSVTGTAGFDALTHAIESYTSKNATMISEWYSHKALELLIPNLLSVPEKMNDKSVRAGLLLGSFFAGVGIANSETGASHALAYPLSIHWKIPHGMAISLLIPHTTRFNTDSSLAKYAEIARLFGTPGSDRDRAASLADSLLSLKKTLGIRQTLKDFGIAHSDIASTLAREAVNLKGPIENNPRLVTSADAEAIYDQAY